MNSSFTETELNNVLLINNVDGPWQNAIHSWETVVFKYWKKIAEIFFRKLFNTVKFISR